jgi:predicted nucleotidyltransferase
MSYYDLVQSHRAEIIHIAAKYGAHNIRLFGSAARREDDQQSDIDFLVDLEPGRTLLDLGAVLMDLRDLLGVEVDVITPKSLKSRIRARVMKDASPL